MNATGLLLYTYMLKPLNGNIIVRPAPVEETVSNGIVIPNLTGMRREPVHRGVVVAVGEGKLLKNGDRANVFVKPGDTVVYGKYAGQEIVHESEELLVMEEYAVFAIVND